MAQTAESLGVILLAAGESSRLGQPKQLLSIDGQTLVWRQANLLLRLKPACVVIVTGAYENEVRQAVAGSSVTIAHNEDWQQGMGRSIACGIGAMPERVRGAMLLLCDQWRVDEDDLDRLLKAWKLNPQKAVAAQWDETSGPPVIFPRSDFIRLQKLQGERGARQVLKRSSSGVDYVPMAHAAIDIDVPSDLP